MSEPFEGQLWRRRVDGVVFRVHYVVGGSHAWIDLRNTETGRPTTISAVGLRRKYSPMEESL